MVKINTLELENIKRIKAVQLNCSGQALTIIGGKNDQGKTSVLDAIAWGLGGDKYKPSSPDREGSVLSANMRITMNNGLVVERKGKNGALKVTDPEGNSSGQTLLNKFISQFALDLPKFLNSNSKEKANTLLQIIGIGHDLERLEDKEQRLYNERQSHGRFADKRKKYADELPYYDDAPKKTVSVSDLIKEQQTILAQNGENQRKREQYKQIQQDHEQTTQEVESLKKQLEAAQARLNQLSEDLATSQKTVEQLEDESTEEIEAKIKSFEEINKKVVANLEKQKAIEEADTLQEQYNELTRQIDDVRKKKIELLNTADLPLPGLNVEDGELMFEGQKWDCMSGSQQMKVATAIVRKLNPECGFVLIDKLEQLDIETLQEFAKWVESTDLQIIATRVSIGDECTIVIEDGMALATSPQFEPGKF